MISSTDRTSVLRQGLSLALVMLLAGWLGYRFAGDPRWIHATIFSIASTIGVLLMVTSVWVSSRFDAILADTEKRGDTVRMRGVTFYVAQSRRELFVFLWTAVLSWVSAGAMAVLLTRTPPLPHPGVDLVWGIGYACVVAIAAYAIRIGRVYLRLDSFRNELFAALDSEKSRASSLRTLNSKSVAPLTRSSGTIHEEGPRRA
jgi:hypothetical protein